MTKRNQHVIPQSGKWAVRGSGTLRASSVHDTQAEAVAAARRIARANRTELYIHGKDGRIREKGTYGPDPSPPKG